MEFRINMHDSTLELLLFELLFKVESMKEKIVLTFLPHTHTSQADSLG
jgi:hypothetical protein